ncbi:hypothetical protein [Agrobacterium tumefaciens]|uniref:hypothetical protein n=1 Tax=Agrobacterium tumefaciens TaxID=358 RepID=UPI001574324F|nr:hypothetical protein [Agrobacterium tumefaciens]
MAYAAAHLVNAVETKFSDRRNGIAQANQLGRALNVTMMDWFETSADSDLNHVNRRGIEQAVSNEAQGAGAVGPASPSILKLLRLPLFRSFVRSHVRRQRPNPRSA